MMKPPTTIGKERKGKGSTRKRKKNPLKTVKPLPPSKRKKRKKNGGPKGRRPKIYRI